MSGAGKLQSNRYELKYIINERKADQIRRFILGQLEPDEFTRGLEGIGYSVHSLYLDSPDFQTCMATVRGAKNRFKLRVRFYDDDPGQPVFFEIKRRVNDVILKQRAMVKYSSVRHLVEGHWPARDDLYRPGDDGAYRALYNFCELQQKIGAGPAAYTIYKREGYEPPNTNEVRVTFDRNLRAGAFRGELTIPEMDRCSHPDIGGVVLELKFTDRFPGWMNTLVQTFDLYRSSMAKYVHCLSAVNDRVRIASRIPNEVFRRPAAAAMV